MPLQDTAEAALEDSEALRILTWVIFSEASSAEGASRRNPNAPQRGGDIHMHIDLTFEEACFGTKKEITISHMEQCTSCHGSGAAEGSHPERCSACGGTGQVKSVQRTPFGSMQTVRTL